jgi:hypothetical protein
MNTKNKIKKRCKEEGCKKLVAAGTPGLCKNHICRCHLSCCKIHETKKKEKIK